MSPPLSAKVLLLGNVMLVVPALWRTLEALKNLKYMESRLIPLAAYRAPLLAMLMAAAIIFVALSWRGSHRAVNWMLTLFSIFVAVCIWESATTFYLLARVGIELREIGILGWLEILWGVSSFVWLGLNVWYFYGRSGIVAGMS